MMSLTVPFDQPNFTGRYEFVLDPSRAENGDGVLLYADQEALLAFATLFQQLAAPHAPTHVHLGYTEQEPQGPGVRIILCETGRQT
jgi:hypothetical protein